MAEVASLTNSAAPAASGAGADGVEVVARDEDYPELATCYYSRLEACALKAQVAELTEATDTAAETSTAAADVAITDIV